MQSQFDIALEALFPSKARRAVLDMLFSGRLASATVSELARRARLTHRAMSVEVEKLQRAGLVLVEAVGPSHVVRANNSHPVAVALEGLLSSAASCAEDDAAEQRTVREALAAYGAPLLGDAPRRHYSLPDTLLRGLKLARADATVLRVLPLVVAQHAHDLDWTDLRERARRMNLKAELGMLLDLTSDVANLPALRKEADPLCDGRRKRERFFLPVHGQFERKLARMRTPASAARWKFYLNMPEDVFRETLRKHAAT
jgi:DNA-binding transcriptional ArsR family regulator